MIVNNVNGVMTLPSKDQIVAPTVKRLVKMHGTENGKHKPTYMHAELHLPGKPVNRYMPRGGSNRYMPRGLANRGLANRGGWEPKVVGEKRFGVCKTCTGGDCTSGGSEWRHR